MNAPDIPITRTGVLAAASVAIATCSVAVTLAVTSGGGEADEPAAAGPRSATGITDPGSPAAGGMPETAKPDAATLYHHSAMERRR